MKTASENENKTCQESKTCQELLDDGLTEEKITELIRKERLIARTSPLPLVEPKPPNLDPKPKPPENKKPKSEVSIKRGWFRIREHCFHKNSVTYYREGLLYVDIFGPNRFEPIGIKFKTKEDLNKFKKLMY